MSRTAFFSKTVSHAVTVPVTRPLSPRATLIVNGQGVRGSVPPALESLFTIKPHVDVFPLQIPANHRYAGAAAFLLGPRAPSGALVRIISQPKSGATGTGDLKVRWWGEADTTVRFLVRAYSEEIPASSTPPAPVSRETVYLHEPGSVDRLASLMDSRRPVRFIIQGDDALKIAATNLDDLLDDFFGPSGTGATSQVVAADDVIIAVAILVAILSALTVSVAALNAMVTLVSKAIEKNYTVTWGFDAGNINVFEGEVRMPSLTFNLTPQ